MNVMEMATALRGAPHLVGFRPPNVLVRRRRLGGFYKVSRNGREHPWQPAGSDLEAIDWCCYTQEQFAKLMRQMMEAEANGQ